MAVNHEILYREGDIPQEWRSSVRDDPECMIGEWEVLLNRSDSCDPILAALNFGLIRRAAMKIHKTRVTVCFQNKENEQLKKVEEGEEAKVKIPEAVHLTTHLPLRKKKEGLLPTNGSTVFVKDDDTSVTWECRTRFIDGRLCQKRMSTLGIMYDIRCVFDQDPEGLTDESPLMLFRWTFVDGVTGERFVANRWLKKISN